MIDWGRWNDPVYRDHVLSTVARTATGKEWLASWVSSLENLPIAEQAIITIQSHMPSPTPGGDLILGALPLIPLVAVALAKGALVKGAVVKGALASASAIAVAWKGLAAGITGKNAILAVGALFAGEFVSAKLKGHTSELEKLYRSGREVGSALVDTSITLTRLLPWLAGGFILYLILSHTRKEDNYGQT